MFRIALASVVLVCVTARVAVAQNAPPQKGAAHPARRSAAPLKARHQADQAKPPALARRVYRVKHVPAPDLAKTLSEFLETEREGRRVGREPPPGTRAVIVPDAITNSLIVSAPADVLDHLGEIVAQLDRQPAMVSIEVLIAEVDLAEGEDQAAGKLLDKAADEGIEAVIADLKKHGRIRVLARPLLTTLDNQPAFINIGRRQPRITGRSATPQGTSNTITIENVGVTLGLTPRINDDGLVTMEVDIDQSRLGPAEEGTPVASAPGGEEVRSPQVEITTLQTTVSAKRDQAVVLGGLIRKEDAQWRGTLILLAPHLARPQ